MPAPFYNAIKGTTAGAAGTGAFTPNAASSGYRAWSNVPTGWIGLVRFEDGAAWELCYCYWNGTTLSRASTQLFDSSTGSQLSLTSAATASMPVDASEVMSHIGTTNWTLWGIGFAAGTALVGLNGSPGITTGTGAVATTANTNYLTAQRRMTFTSATTANAQSGSTILSAAGAALVSTTAGKGGFEQVARWGASQIPTGPRLFIGMTSVTFVGNTGEPSVFQSANYAVFAKDSGDTNIQLLTNDGTATNGTKIDTGIPLVVNGWYESHIWCEPGSNKIYALLIRMDTGAIWFGSTTTDVPADASIMSPQILGGLSSTTGTAMILNIASMALRSGS